MQIQFDHTNLLAAMAGEANGLTREEIETAGGRAQHALASFKQQSEAGAIGFPHLPFQDRDINAIARYASSVRGDYDTVCLVGIGGSALGAWALDCGIRGPHPVQGRFTPEHPRLVILDNVDPAFTEAALASMNPRRTIVVVVAKSGSTAETMATFLMVRERLRPKQVAVVTTNGEGDLFALATKERHKKFYIPKNVGGRFSVLSAAGLLPAALTGINIRKLTRGAAAITHQCWLPELAENPALRAALYHYLIWTRKRKSIHVAFPYSNHLWGTAFWFRQLWAESLGKARIRPGAETHCGQTPVAALGTTDQHSQVQLYIEGPNDKVFTFWAVEDFGAAGRIPEGNWNLASLDYLAGQSLARLIDSERRATAAALTHEGRPNCTFTLERVDEENLGAFLQLMEFQTAFMGELLDIDAFNQDGVELGKKFTFGLMGRAGYEEYARQFEAYEKRRAAASE